MKSISDAALLYALRELSRRAGVSFEFFSNWDILRNEEGLVVRPQTGMRGTVLFPVRCIGKRVARKTWGDPGKINSRCRVGDFVVPFSSTETEDCEPLFLETVPGEFHCTEDLLTSLLLTLCRVEEREAKTTDLHGRFPASAGIAARNGNRWNRLALRAV